MKIAYHFHASRGRLGALGAVLPVLKNYLNPTAWQERDLVEFNGQWHHIEGRTPLEVYFDQYPEFRPAAFSSDWPRLQRGYVATWCVHQNRLWLLSLESIAPVNETAASMRGTMGLKRPLYPFPLDHLFQGARAIVPADWYTGEMVIAFSMFDGLRIGAMAMTKVTAHVLNIERGWLVSDDERSFTARKQWDAD